MEFTRQEYRSGLPFLSPGDLPDPGIEPASPALEGGFFTTEPPGKPSYLFFFSSLFKPKLSRCGQLESFQIATVSFWQDPMICCWKQTHQDISSGNLNINVGDTPKLLCFIIFYSASQLVQWKVPRRKKWQPTPVFLPGESHGQRSLAGYSPWSHKESDMIEHTRTHNFY